MVSNVIGYGSEHLSGVSQPSIKAAGNTHLPRKTAAFPNTEAAASNSFSLCFTPSSYQVAVSKINTGE